MDEKVDQVREELAKYQDSNGIDLSLLRANLQLSLEERVEQHDKAVRFMLECMRAAEAAETEQTRSSR